MLPLRQREALSQQQLLEILEDVYRKGSDSSNINAKQLIDDIVIQLSPFVQTT
ncbi:hypothetical protein [Bacillus suaedae]|uniref:Uncharacterized protein n=1 Tax=Halalkalibacter suaedae TaxID=2822140 RepID=A0A941AND8_9BACI|nr:hypothetical protein [Bacillus suaedae]MBP3950217.1 hypothetical protein [Bacillus suaedae]